jgi:hypothetical protein
MLKFSKNSFFRECSVGKENRDLGQGYLFSTWNLQNQLINQLIIQGPH